MFHPCDEPLLLSQAGLQGLCLSLNTPVINIEELPVGPAQAAIVLFDPGYGTLSLGVGIRSLETRRVAVFVYRGLIDETKTPGETMNAALAFAEGMGFLFDEDLVSGGEGGGHARALAAWNDLTQETATAPADRGAQVAAQVAAQRVPEPAAETQSPLSSPPPAAQELVLDDLAEDASNELLLDDLSGEISIGGDDADAEDKDPLDEVLLDLADDVIEFEREPTASASPASAPPEAPAPAAPPAPVRPAPAAAEAAPARPSAASSERAAPTAAQASPRKAAPLRDQSQRAREAAGGAPAAAPAQAEAPAASRVPLSKFRKPAADEAEQGGREASKGSELGRVAIVRKQVGGDAEDRPSLLMRILTHF